MDAEDAVPIKDRLTNEMKRRKVKTPELAKATGIPKDRIYKWYAEGTQPKLEDAQKLEKWINMEKTPIQEKMEVNDAKTAIDPMQLLFRLTTSMEKLVESKIIDSRSMEKMAEAHKIDSESIQELLHLVKANIPAPQQLNPPVEPTNRHIDITETAP